MPVYPISSEHANIVAGLYRAGFPQDVEEGVYREYAYMDLEGNCWVSTTSFTGPQSETWMLNPSTTRMSEVIAKEFQDPSDPEACHFIVVEQFSKMVQPKVGNLLLHQTVQRLVGIMPYRIMWVRDGNILYEVEDSDLHHGIAKLYIKMKYDLKRLSELFGNNPSFKLAYLVPGLLEKFGPKVDEK